MKHSTLQILLLGILLLISAGCTPKQPATPETIVPVPHDAAWAVWNRFEAYSEERGAEKSPFRIRCGLRYANQGEGSRATAILWGNGDMPLRLDVMAMGTSVARIRQDNSELVIYSPREGKAWVHTGPEQAFLAFGMPLPLSLPDITALLQGRYQDVFGALTWDAPLQYGEDIRFALRGGRLPGFVDISPEGLLSAWEEAPGGWTLTVAYEGTPPLPARLDIRHPEGRHAVLTVADREQAPAFSPERMALALPQGTTFANLRQALR